MTGAAGEDPRPTAVVVMGVAGSGKTTIAAMLSQRLGWPVAEADDFHSAANIAKMSAGVPLTDADRAPWLRALRDWISSEHRDVIITCSALRRSYRDVLRTAEARVRFLHLDGSADLIAARIAARTGHFMPPALLASQLAALETLEPDEDGVSVPVTDAPDEVAEAALRALALRPRAAEEPRRWRPGS